MINVSIFDVIPHNLYSRAFMLPEDRYRVSEICIKFLSDIIKCLDSNDIIIYLKSKHHLNSNSYPQDYINFVKNINKDNIVKLTQDIHQNFLQKICIFQFHLLLQLLLFIIPN